MTQLLTSFVHRTAGAVFVLAGLLTGVPIAPAQTCGPQYLGGEAWPPASTSPAPVVNTSVLWDPDGPGPRGRVLVVAGSNVSPRFFDPVTKAWRWLPAVPFPPAVSQFSWSKLVVQPDGTLVAGLSQGGDTRWGVLFALEPSFDVGTGVWTSAISPAVNTPVVNDLVIAPSGNLIAAGTLTLRQASGVNTTGAIFERVAGQWQNISPPGITSVSRVAFAPSGQFIAVGTTASGVFLATRTGTTWSIQQTTTVGTIVDLAVAPAGQIYLSGSLRLQGETTNRLLLTWSGSSWAAVPNLPAITGNGGLAIDVDGSLLVRGNPVQRLTGNTWSAVGPTFRNSSTVGTILRLPEPDGRLIIAGRFTDTASQIVQSIAALEGGEWVPLTPGSNLPIARISADRAGQFRTSRSDFVGTFNSSPARIALISNWDGAGWRESEPTIRGRPAGVAFPPSVARDWTGPSRPAPLSGTPVSPPALGPVVFASGTGTLIDASGATYSVGSNLLTWNGTRWGPLGNNISASPLPSLSQTVGGDVFLGFGFSQFSFPSAQLSRFNGTTWTPVSGWPGLLVTAALPHPNGSLILAGRTASGPSTATSALQIWNGQTVVDQAGLQNLSNARAIDLMPGGDVLLAGEIYRTGASSPEVVVRWNGSSFRSYGLSPPVFVQNVDVAAIDDERFAVLSFAGSGINTLSRWNGDAFVGMARDGTTDAPSATVFANSLSIESNSAGEVALAGAFDSIGATAAKDFVRWTGTGAPWVARHPDATFTVTEGQTVTLTATPAADYRRVTVRWTRDGQTILNGPQGAAIGGGVISGAIQVMESPTAGLPGVLTITGATCADSGVYRATVQNACGSATSLSTVVTISGCPCGRSDIAGVNQTEGPDGSLNADDIITYLNWYFASDLRADVARTNQLPIPDGQLSADDILVFLNRYFLGC